MKQDSVFPGRADRAESIFPRPLKTNDEDAPKRILCVAKSIDEEHIGRRERAGSDLDGRERKGRS